MVEARSVNNVKNTHTQEVGGHKGLKAYVRIVQD